jgi:hypothetical protein
MRRVLVLLGVLALALPAAAGAGRTDTGEGTLQVKNGRGTFIIIARGGIIGSFAKGRVVITDPVEGDGTGPIVSGSDWHRERSETTDVYGGTAVRFRLIGGAFKVRVVATGVNLSVIGRGNVILNGAGTEDDGMYSVNEGLWAVVPDLAQFALSASTP